MLSNINRANMKTFHHASEINEENTKVPRVLVVDDNVDLADTMSLLLRDLGCYVETAYHPIAALSKCEKQKFDYFVLDIGLPEITGYDLIKALLKNEENRDATFFAYSAYSDKVFQQRSLEAGFKHHFVKPSDFSKIIDEITKSAGALN